MRVMHDAGFECLYRRVLPNGFRVLVYEMPYAKTITAEIFVKAGSRYEPIPGISHFLEHMIAEGSQKYPSAKNVLKAVKKHAAIKRFTTYKEYVTYTIKLPCEYKVFPFEFLRELLFNPLMKPETIAMEKNIILREIDLRTRSLAEYTANVLLPQHIWGRGHPLGRNSLGSKRSILSLSRDKLIDFHRKFYIPSNMVLAVAGNVDVNEVFELSEVYFGDLHSAKQKLDTATTINLPRNRGTLIKRGNAPLSFIAVGIVTKITFQSDDFPALAVLNNLVGNQIFYKFVYDLGFSYVADAHPVTVFADYSELNFLVQVSPEKTEEAFKLLINEVNNVKIDDEAFEEAKNDAKRSLFFSLIDTDDYARFIGMQETLYGSVKTPQQVKLDIDQVSLGDVDRLKKELIKDENLGSVIFGPINASIKKKLTHKYNQ